MKPYIAIPASRLGLEVHHINERAGFYGASDLTAAIETTGGFPVILPVPEKAKEAEVYAAQALAHFDGFIFQGGEDISPIFYGEEPLRSLEKIDPGRDAFEIALVKAAQKLGKPIFGICRGLQIINVALGGSLYQDLVSQRREGLLQHSQKSEGWQESHKVRLSPDSELFQIFNEKAEIFVNSRHHEAVKEVATGLKQTAEAVDGVVEGLEGEGILAVQWHPENLWRHNPGQLQLFETFVKKSCRA